MSTRPSTDGWTNSDAEYGIVKYRRPKCPACGSVRLRAHHSDKRVSGLIVRHSQCVTCGQRLHVIAE